MEAVDSHNHSLESFFDLVPVVTVEMTVQVVTTQGNQRPTSIDEKLWVGNIVFLGESMEERLRGVGPTVAEYIHFEQEF